MNLQERVENAYACGPGQIPESTVPACFEELMAGLNDGSIRAAEKHDEDWIVNGWVKKGILLGFRLGVMEDMSVDRRFVYYDKHTFPLKEIRLDDGVRIVPGGSSIRDGVYVGKNVICMPPMYINVGAYVDEGTLVDSHALVGSCAQIGKRVHLSAGSQIGGVLEPVGQMPVIIEDDVLVGGNCGIYEGIIVRKGAVIAAGTILTGSTPVYDTVRDRILRRTGDAPLEIPENAVVIPGSRPVPEGPGKTRGLSLYCPVIVKYRDEKTDRATALEDALR